MKAKIAISISKELKIELQERIKTTPFAYNRSLYIESLLRKQLKMKPIVDEHEKYEMEDGDLCDPRIFYERVIKSQIIRLERKVNKLLLDQSS